MIDRSTRLRYRRKIKNRQKKVKNASKTAEETINKHFFRRLNRFLYVRRFVFSWIMLVFLMCLGVVVQNRGLTGIYQDEVPAKGGTYIEGQLGTFTNANPIFATGDVDRTLSKLVFSGLMKYNQDNDLVGDIAKSVKTDDRGLKYSVKLRDDIYWHDGEQLTSSDVVFTYETIQLPDTQSPLRPIWQKIKIQKKGKFGVVFTLPHNLASFPHSLTTGIIPKHLLSNIPPSKLRSVGFNTESPVGTGPFMWGVVEVEGNTPEDRQERIGLKRNDGYYEGAPFIEKFVVRAFHDPEELKKSFHKGEITAVSGTGQLPVSLNSNVEERLNMPLMAQVMAFLNNSNDILSDVKVRQAIARATDTDAIIKSLNYPVIKSDSILLKNHIGYDKNETQLKTNLRKAEDLLDKAGWKKSQSGIRKKGNRQLELTLFTKETRDYSIVSSALQDQWRKAGIKLDVRLQSDEELESTIAFHNYDVLLYGISVGNDPDVYAYWHSSQADAVSGSRLNFSEYKSTIVDQALEAGRSRVSPKVRAIKYSPMLISFKNDAPAIALYQPRLLYITSRDVHNLSPGTISTAVDRFSNVENWSIKVKRADKT